jgi:hypothetical protein
MPITPWEDIAGKKCKCGELASHYYCNVPVCCKCHRSQIGEHGGEYFSKEDVKLAHKKVLKERRVANKYHEIEE